MVIGKFLCPLWGRILYLQQGLMQQCYLLLMLAVDTCYLRNKNDEKQRREDLVKGGWREDPEPFILVCCIKQCYKRGLRFCCVTFLLVYYFGNAKIHCIFSKNEKKFPASAGLVLYSCVTAGFMIYL